ncbi:hypothetical protein K438DRAFT_1784595 [Mycena galopus ATCC 62051]|nr:hypothetical protein K438DRAFT_1784595 [Mycena galopus ATCC 62051]
MQRGEDTNFLRLTAALKILVGSSIRLDADGLPRAEELLRESLHSGAKSADPRPSRIGRDRSDSCPINYQYHVIVTSIPKSSGKTSFDEVGRPRQGLPSCAPQGSAQLGQANLGRPCRGGSAELDKHLHTSLNGILDETSGPNVPRTLQWEHQLILFGTGEDKEALGTIQDAATHERTLSRVVAGSIADKSARIEDDILRVGLMDYYSWTGHNVRLPWAAQQPEGTDSEVLGSFGEIYNYALLNGRRITPTARSKRGAGSALV